MKNIFTNTVFSILFLFGGFLTISYSVFASDADGSATLTLSSDFQIESESIVGKNFSVQIVFHNALISEEDAYNPGFVVQVPDLVNFVSSSNLGSPVRILNLPDTSKLLFFETQGLIPRGTSQTYNITLSSNTSIELFTLKDIKVLSYAEDNIYGRGVPPSGSPFGTLFGGLDFSESSYVSIPANFPDSILVQADILGLPFESLQTQFIPFNIEKIAADELLIGKTQEVTLRIRGNDLGSLKNFSLADTLPNTQRFIGFTQTGGVGNISVLRDFPSSGNVTLNIEGINVATGASLDIKYQVEALAFPIGSHTGTTAILNTSSPLSHNTVSTNTLTMLGTGSWNNGLGDILINTGSIISPKSKTTQLTYTELTKSVNVSRPEIGDILRYTVRLKIAENISFDTSGSGTYIRDILPDGVSYNSFISSTNSGGGNMLFFSGATVNADGSTDILWYLPSGELQGGDIVEITYDTLLDGIFEGGGVNEYINTEILTSTAELFGNIAESGNNELWGYTDPSIINTLHTDTANVNITAPIPEQQKFLVAIHTPDSTTYDANNPLPLNFGIPVGSRLDFVVSMDFPSAYFSGAVLKDALPLITGPNEDAYNISFQTITNLSDIEGNPVPYNNDDADIASETIFNGLTLGGPLPGDSPWIQTSPANNIEFHLGSGDGGKTFALRFSVDVLPVKPNSPGVATLSIKNVLVGQTQNSFGSITSLGTQNIPFVLGFPVVKVQKDTLPATLTGVSFGKEVDYRVILENTGSSDAYLENIIDTVPAHMTLQSFSMVYSGGLMTSLSGATITQSGSELSFSFDTQAPLQRSLLPLDNPLTSGTIESLIIIDYTLAPTQDFRIIPLENRVNTIELDYYSTADASSNAVNKIETVTDTASFSVAVPSIARSIFSSTEADSIGNDLLSGEDVTFRTTLTLPAGTYMTGSFTENILTSHLTFLSGAIISQGPNISIETGTGFVGSVLSFGKIVNTGTGSETLIIETTSRSRNNVTRRNNNRAQGEFRYNGQTLLQNTAVDLFVPTLNLLKSVTPSTGDSEDIFTYTLAISHNGSSNAPAYDLVLKDILPSYLTYIPGSLTGALTFSGSEADLFSNTGITLSTLPLANTRSVQFQALLGTGASAAQSITNTGTLAYSTLDDDASILETNFSATGSTAFQVRDVQISHSIFSSSDVATGQTYFNPSFPDIVPGEEITYDIFVSVPELLLQDMRVFHELPVGMRFLTGSLFFSGVKDVTPGAITISPENTLEFDIGDIDNTGVGAGTGFIFRTTAVLLDIPANTSGDIFSSTSRVTYDVSKSKIHNGPSIDVVEPNLQVTKTFGSGASLPGQSLLTTILVQNTGISPLYNISWIDTLPPKTTALGSYSSSGTTGTLLPGESYTYTYETVLDNTVVYGETLTGSLSASGSSLSSLGGETRVYEDSDTETVLVLGIQGVQKNLVGSALRRVGDTVGYTLLIPVSEGFTSLIQVDDLIPSGLAIIPSSINLSNSVGVSYSGSVVPSIGSINSGIPQTIQYVFPQVQNTNNSSGTQEFITLSYEAVVLNVSEIQEGILKAEAVEVDYSSGASILQASAPQITIQEPEVSLVTQSMYTYGHTGSLVFTLTNSGSTSAYDLVMDIDIPAGLTLSGSTVVTNSGGMVGYTLSGSQIFIEHLPQNTGNPTQFSLPFVLADTIVSLTSLQIDIQLQYSSFLGSYTPEIGDAQNTERTGDGNGNNDYRDTSNISLEVRLPLLETFLTRRDLNLGPSIVGDTFEYTLTLSNTGHVDLTGIDILSQIPAGFTGFTLISLPSGATNLSSATGGLAQVGLIDLRDISLTIGSTTTLVYQLTSLSSLASQTSLTESIQVSSSDQGSEGRDLIGVLELLSGALTLTKNITEPTRILLLRAGDTLQYIFTIENTGDVTLSGLILDDPLLGGDITSTCIFPSLTGSLLPGERASCTASLYTVTPSDASLKKIQNTATVYSEDQSSNEIGDTDSIEVLFRSIGGGGTSNGSSVKKDSCSSGDLSGNFSDGLCETPKITIPDVASSEEVPQGEENITEDEGVEETIPQEETESFETQKVAPNGQKYSMKNTFSSCPIIDDINNTEYQYQESGVFSDENEALYKSIMLKFAQIGIIDGYDNGTLKPLQKMTRAEFLKVALISHCYTYRELSGTSKYTDLEPGTWQSKVVEKSEMLGMIHGYSDGSFQPNKEISKAEAIKILMRLSFIYANTPVEVSYKDITVGWHQDYVKTGETLGLFDASQDNYLFQPDLGVQRQEMVDLIYRLVKLYQ